MVTDVLFHASTENEKVTTFIHGVRVRMCVSVSAASTQKEFSDLVYPHSDSKPSYDAHLRCFRALQSPNIEHRSWEVL